MISSTFVILYYGGFFYQMYNLLSEFTCSINHIPTFTQDIFRFILNIFEELNDTDSPFFSKRAKLLETVAKLRFCLVMLDIGCEDLVLAMFESFFSVVRFAFPPPAFLAVLFLLFCAFLLAIKDVSYMAATIFMLFLPLNLSKKA